eukprot:TRINITY_DN12176_c1_g1_i1.p1 TRINITY_DN12176_c1_g1~~TRINITY_DN12176_c1_g1_i1.p1  ORF type:complete len:151 (+),score=30.67 TRINITY_DN12176_c1_g1_i1:271-723(+)
MTTAALARQLLDECIPFVRRYNFGAAAFGVAMGWYDGPRPPKVQPPPSPPQQDEQQPAMSAAQRSAELARRAMTEQPQELGFVRQFILTSPGVVLALRLGRRARELQAPPRALALAALPSLSCPLLLYILGGYPTGAALRHWKDSREVAS